MIPGSQAYSFPHDLSSSQFDEASVMQISVSPIMWSQEQQIDCLGLKNINKQFDPDGAPFQEVFAQKIRGSSGPGTSLAQFGALAQLR